MASSKLLLMWALLWWSRCEVTANKIAPKLQDFSFPIHAALGKRAEVHCSVYEGDGPFDFSWTKDGLLLKSPHRATIRQLTESSSLLTLEAVTVGDIGNYTCVVSS
ncbi:unnamed protein product, partial [Ixodes persulcatus]